MSENFADGEPFVREATDPNGISYWVQSATVHNGHWWAVPGEISSVEWHTLRSLVARVRATLQRRRKYDGEVFVLVFRKADESAALTWSGAYMSEARDQADAIIREIEAGVFTPTE
jgi:hypothetical protein